MQLSRLELLIGKEKLLKIKNTTVLIIGLGGVGSYALETLARSGIGKLIIVDKDIIDITNLNRQMMSLHSNIGKNKVDVWEERIRDINPNIIVEKINDFINKENIEKLFQEKIDYVIDACDTVETKIELIKKCHEKGIKLISSMGTGKRLDATKLEVVEIKKTSYDPLAKVIRKRLRDEKINYKVMVVCSKEPPLKINSDIIASSAFVPATSGLLCANYVINQIIGDDR